jgi:hypothetical protein
MAGRGAGLSGLKAAAIKRTPVTARKADPRSCHVKVPKEVTKWEDASSA